MITIENVDVYGFDVAIRAMRNSFDSWEKSDSEWKNEEYVLGKDDLALMRKLIDAGDSHAKFARLITVTCDITAPRYWWTEFDTYKVGTVRCSCSTMHTITDKEFTVDDFSFDAYEKGHNVTGVIVNILNEYRTAYLEGKERRWWNMIIQLLPQSYNQKSTVMMNYQVLRHMYHARKNHKLSEWHDFCDWVEELPYADELIICE